jgi:hypothetical protein
LPLGFLFITIVIVIVEMIVSVIWWNKWMVHFPEDDTPWDETTPLLCRKNKHENNRG